MPQDVVTMDKVVALCKRRGFIFRSSEIYGGLGSTYDYGHYGVLLKTNVKNAWWQAMLSRDDIVALDSAILQHPRVWEASGHVGGFSDPMVDCRACKSRFRADQLIGLEFEWAGEPPRELQGKRLIFSGIGTEREVLEKNEKKIDQFKKKYGSLVGS